MPPVPKPVSSEPSVLYRATENQPTPPSGTSLRPTATILPSAWRARPRASSEPPAKSVVTLPPVPKPVSSEPSVLYRARAKSSPAPA